MTERLKDLITSAEKCIRDGELDRGIHLLHDSLDSYKSTPIDDDDKEILSVIYSQLGNAYYMRKDFAKACEFHGKDCEVSSTNSIQKAKALSNYSMALAMDKQFGVALSAARDVISEAANMNSDEAKSFNCRGYYNLGMAFLQFYYFSKDRDDFDPVCFDYLDEAKHAFTKCLEFSIGHLEDGHADPVSNLFYNLAVGNLGIVYYFSQNYTDAIRFYKKRLQTAIESGDQAAQLRTSINLGNACLQLGNPAESVCHYYEALELLQTRSDPDPATKARLHFNIANMEFLLKNYKKAIQNFAEACKFAELINDTATIAESFQQIALLFERMNLVPEALYYLIQRYKMEEQRALLAAQQLSEACDSSKENCPQKNLQRSQAMDTAKSDIERFVRKHPDQCVTSNRRVNARPARNMEHLDHSINNGSSPTFPAPLSVDRPRPNDENLPMNEFQNVSTSIELINSSMESFILEVAESANSSSTNHSSSGRRGQHYEVSSTTTADDEDDFSSADVGFSRSSNYTPANMAAVSVSSLPLEDKTPGPSSDRTHEKPEEDFLDFYARVSSRRIDEQRGELTEEPIHDDAVDFTGNVLRPSAPNNNPEEIFDLIVSLQGRRFNDQRANLVMSKVGETSEEKKPIASRSNQETSEDRLYDLIITKQSDRLDDQRSELGGRPPQPCSTLPIELPDDVTELIVAMQAGRYESQRAYLKPPHSSDSQLNTGQPDDESSSKQCVSSSSTVNTEAISN